MTVSEFADTERHLSSEASAMVGLWDTSVTEYLRGVMDAVSDSSIEIGSDVGKSVREN